MTSIIDRQYISALGTHCHNNHAIICVLKMYIITVNIGIHLIYPGR